ncbi:MAG: IclR family transcriptional regulator [Solirubrobacteraceae bacterium]
MSSPDSWHVARTLRALEALALGPRTAVDVADALMVTPRTARRLLNRLVDEGYATRRDSPTRVYVSTLRLVAVAGQVVHSTELVQAAGPHLRRLHDETAMAAHLSVPSLLAVLCVLHAAGEQHPPVPSLGERIPCHATAAGKALLAFRPSWRAHMLTQPLESFTPRTLTDRRRLETEARAVRARGHAVEDGEYRLGEHGIAAPVFSHTGEAVAALGVSAPGGHMSRRRARELGDLVARTALAVSEDVGYARAADEPPMVAGG